MLLLPILLVVFEGDLRVGPQRLRAVEDLLFLGVLRTVLLEQLAVLCALLGLILTLPAGLAILQNAVRASDRRQKLCFSSVHSRPLLRTVRNHEGLTCCCLLFQALLELGLVLVLQLGQSGGLLLLVEVRVRRILVLRLFFRGH